MFLTVARLVNCDAALLLSTSYLTASFLSRKFRTEFANEAPLPEDFLAALKLLQR
jgi:hypothetical protein